MEGGHRECLRKGDSVGTTSGLAHGDVSWLREQDGIGSRPPCGAERVGGTGDELSKGVVGWREEGEPNT